MSDSELSLVNRMDQGLRTARLGEVGNRFFPALPRQDSGPDEGRRRFWTTESLVLDPRATCAPRLPPSARLRCTTAKGGGKSIRGSFFTFASSSPPATPAVPRLCSLSSPWRLYLPLPLLPRTRGQQGGLGSWGPGRSGLVPRAGLDFRGSQGKRRRIVQTADMTGKKVKTEI